MTSFIFIMTLMLGPGPQSYVVDYNLTQTKCQAMRAYPWITRYGPQFVSTKCIQGQMT